MTYLSQAAEAALAEMTPSEVTALLARVRPGIEQSDPIDQAEAELSARANAKKNRAAAVLRHTRAGSDDTGDQGTRGGCVGLVQVRQLTKQLQQMLQLIGSTRNPLGHNII